jgi:hypothetical protein
MSVASMAGYLANSGGGGGQSSYYKDFSNSGPSTIIPGGELTTLFDIQVPSAGTYLITTFLTLQSYVLNETGEYETAPIINTAAAYVLYQDNGYTLINDQTFVSGSTTPECIIQTSGIFVSTGTGNLLINVKVAVTGDATHYNVILNDEFTPQVQIASIITGSGGGGGDGTFDIVTIGDTKTVELSCTEDEVLSVANINVTESGGGITFPNGSKQTIAYEGGGSGNTFDNITIGSDPKQVVLSCDASDILTVDGIYTEGVEIKNDSGGSAYLTCTDDKVLLVDDVVVATQTYVATTYQTQAGMTNYYTSTQADGLFQSLTDMANYSTTAIANGLYQSLTDMANYSTTAIANGLYAPINSGVTSLTAGTGIGVDTSTGVVTISNTGVAALTAGAGITITGTNDNKTITNISSAPVITTYNLPTELALTPVNTPIELMNEGTAFIPLAGTYIINIFLLMQSYNASGTTGPYIGSGTIYLVFNNIEYINQPFTNTTNAEPAFFQASSTIHCNGTDFIQLVLLVNSLSTGGTQYNTGPNPPNYAPLITLTQIG